MSFAVKSGLEPVAEEWLRMLVERQAECVKTLESEHMYYESVFKSVRAGRMYLSWFSVQGSGGARVQDSSHEVDRLHLEYWHKCIDSSVPPEIHEHVVSFVPECVAKAIAEQNAL